MVVFQTLILLTLLMYLLDYLELILKAILATHLVPHSQCIAGLLNIHVRCKGSSVLNIPETILKAFSTPHPVTHGQCMRELINTPNNKNSETECIKHSYSYKDPWKVKRRTTYPNVHTNMVLTSYFTCHMSNDVILMLVC